MTYNYGELTNSRSIQYDSLYIAPLSAYEAGKKKKDMESNDFICPVDICPEPVGGLEEIEKKLVYPELAKQFNLEGYVLLTAAINLRGKPVNIRVNKGLGLGCDEAAVEAVKNTNFIPGRNKGEEVETDVTFKVSFRLSDEDDRAPHSGENIEISGTETAAANSLDENEGFIECDSDICPKPVGGIIELLNNLKYPPQAERNNISGNVIVEAEVDELGFVISAEIIKGIGYGCDEAAKRAVIKTQFEPGQENNMDSKSKIKITVPFILNNE
jgi:TonB family protein